MGRFATITLARQLGEAVKREKPDILHTHLWPACKIAARATRTLPIQHVWHVHDTPAWLTSKSVPALLQRAQLRLMVARHKPLLLACSESARRDVLRGLRIYAARVATIRNGVDTNQFYPRSEHSIYRSGPVKLIMAAAFRPAKGHLHLLEAVERLARQGIHFELTLAGDANSGTGDLVRREVIRRGLTEVVRFAGQVADMAALLRKHEVFVLPSESEGLPLCILEAMACGLAVVATRVGGVPEIVEEGKNGLLFDPGRPAQLAECLQKLIGSGELRGRLGEAGARRVARSFSFKECAVRIVEAYNGR
jgi:glycosyltransferase involved in cell wall biosynthesis